MTNRYPITKGFKGLIGFFTILPVGMEPIEATAEAFFLCPLIALMIGFITGVVGCISNVLLPTSISGFIVLASMQILIGFHHFDGLLDFSDAAMVRAGPEKRLEVMHDKFTGAAAVAVGLIVFVMTGLSFGYFANLELLRVAIVSEVMAKESMVLTAYLAKTPSYEGTGYHMVASMKKSHTRLLSSLVLSAFIVFSVLGISSISAFIGVFIAMVITVTILTAFSNRAFAGVTGDVLGAANEISRMVSLLVLLAILI
jgi:adenosylcobinamide-GDP ribazoletransferase